jgi:biotin operon repressor
MSKDSTQDDIATLQGRLEDIQVQVGEALDSVRAAADLIEQAVKELKDIGWEVEQTWEER